MVGNVGMAYRMSGASTLASLEPALETTLSNLTKSSNSANNASSDSQQQQQQQQQLPQHHQHAHHAHLIVHHSYHDHSHDSRTDYQEEHPARGGVSTPFPLKLHEMLDAVDGNGHSHIVSWQPHGRCFVVHKPREFVELLPTYFKLSKLASFQRQLNLYGFQRLTRGRDRGAYYHELFLRGRVFMAHNIQRMKVKGTGVRARANPDDEPDFWGMPWIEPLSASELLKQQQKHQEQQKTQQQASSKPSSYDVVMPASVPKNGFDDTRVLPSNFSTTIRPTVTGDYYTPVVPKSSIGSSSYQQYTVVPSSPSVSKNTATTVTSSKNRLDDDDDIICAFGNKTFHYLDPFQSHQPSSYQKKPAPVYSLSSSSQQQPQLQSQQQIWYTKPQPYAQFQQQQRVEEDVLLSTEAESFFENFDFSPIVDAATASSNTNNDYNYSSTNNDFGGIEDDAVFGDMLETLIQ